MTITTPAQQSERTEEQFDLLVRVWHSRSSGATAVTQNSRFRARALVEDILTSRLDAKPEIGEEGYLYASGRSQLGKALAASRALQLAFEGFRSAFPPARANVSVMLDKPAGQNGARNQTGPSVEQMSLLDSANPSQVLITQSFYDSVARCHPVPLRSFPPRAGVYEFLWTNEERLEALQADREFLATLVGLPVATATATPASQQSQPTLLRTRAASLDSEESTGSSGIFHWLFEDRHSAERLAGAGVVLAALIAGAWFGIGHLGRGNEVKPRIQNPSPPPLIIERPATNPRVPTVSSNPGGPVDTGNTKIDASQQPVIPKSQPKGTTITPAPTKPRPTQGDSNIYAPTPQPRHGCSLDPGEIPQYLAMAEGNRNRGKYEDAQREYERVLACEPGNREARQGLQRAKDAERFSPPQ
jgi:hypothetical protein